MLCNHKGSRKGEVERSDTERSGDAMLLPLEEEARRKVGGLLKLAKIGNGFFPRDSRKISPADTLTVVQRG